MKRPAPKPTALRRLPPVRRNGTELLDHLAEHLPLSRRAAKNLLDERLGALGEQREVLRRAWEAQQMGIDLDAIRREHLETETFENNAKRQDDQLAVYRHLTSRFGDSSSAVD